MRVINGGNWSHARGVKYPIVISEDTEYRGSNFAQESPHTEIFSVEPAADSLVNPTLRFVECNLVNVKVPDGAEIVGGNLAHLVRTATGGAAKPFINLLHECEKCSTAVKEIREAIEGGDLPKDEAGRILHHEMKVRFAARREFEMLVESDVADLSDENAAALEKWSK